MTIQKYLCTLGLLLGAALFAAPAQAQWCEGMYCEEDEILDEIIVYGVQTDFEDYFTITMYTVPEGWGIAAWIDNILDFMNDFVDLINVAASDPDFDPIGDCVADQAAFRSECLSLASTANNLCIVTIGPIARIVGPVGSVVGFGCSETYSNAQSACNTAADNYSWPEANNLCAGATGD